MLNALRRFSWPERATPYIVGALIGGLAFAVFNMSNPSPCSTAHAQALCPVANSSVFSGTYGVQSGSAFTATFDMETDPTVAIDIAFPTEDGTVAYIATTQTLTNKTVNLTSNTLVSTSAQLLAALTDETGTGVAVFGTGPTIVGATVSADLEFNDNIAAAFGSSDRSRIYHDGTDSVWNLRSVGSGDLMIALAAGYPSPDTGAVHIWEGPAAGDPTADGSSFLILETDNTANFLTFLQPLDGQGGIAIGDSDSALSGRLTYTGRTAGDPSTWHFWTAATERLLYSENAFAFQEATTISTTADDLTLTPFVDVIVSTGQLELNDAIRFDTAVSDPTTVAIWNRSAAAGRMGFNVLSGKEYNFMVNALEIMSLTGSALNFTTAHSISTSADNLTLSPDSELILGTGGVAQMQTIGWTIGLAASAPAPSTASTVWIWESDTTATGISSNSLFNIMREGNLYMSLLTGDSHTAGYMVGDGNNDIDSGRLWYNTGTEDWTIYASGDPVVVMGPTGLGVEDLDITNVGTIDLDRIDPDGDSIGIGAAQIGSAFIHIDKSFVSDGSTTSAIYVNFAGALEGASGDTDYITGARFSTNITTQSVSESIGKVTSVKIDEPQITLGTGSSVGISAALWLTGTASEAANNYTLWASGRARFDSGMIIGGSDSVNQLFSDASAGTASTPLYIGDEQIDTTASDRRLKTDITPLVSIDAAAWLREAAGYLVEFEWVSEDHQHYGDGRNLGFIAQDFIEFSPQLTNDNGESTWAVKYAQMTPYLIAGWAEHDTRIEALEATVDTLEARIAALEAAA